MRQRLFFTRQLNRSYKEERIWTNWSKRAGRSMRSQKYFTRRPRDKVSLVKIDFKSTIIIDMSLPRRFLLHSHVDSRHAHLVCHILYLIGYPALSSWRTLGSLLHVCLSSLIRSFGSRCAIHLAFFLSTYVSVDLLPKKIARNQDQTRSKCLYSIRPPPRGQRTVRCFLALAQTSLICSQ